MNMKRNQIQKVVQCYTDSETFEDISIDYTDNLNPVWIDKDMYNSDKRFSEVLDQDAQELLLNGEVDFVVLNND